MKLDLEKLIQRTAQVAQTWAFYSRMGDELPTEDLRPSFIAHRLICSIVELEELFAVHKALWPKDQVWRANNGEYMVDQLPPTSTLINLALSVADEEKPNPKIINTQDIDDLFYFFCQIRKTIQFEIFSSGISSISRDFRTSVETATEVVLKFDQSKRYALEKLLSNFLKNSFIYSRVRLSGGATLQERYQPLFRVVQLLRGEKNMKIDEIREILKEAEIKAETRNRASELIEELSRLLSDYDLDQIREILVSGGELFEGLSEDGGIVVLQGERTGKCAPIVLAIAMGKDGRTRFGLPNVMKQVRAHLIRCFEIAEVVILLTDLWDPNLMKESESDFIAYSSRSYGRKILIPIVSWKRQLTTYPWP